MGRREFWGELYFSCFEDAQRNSTNHLFTEKNTTILTNDFYIICGVVDMGDSGIGSDVELGGKGCQKATVTVLRKKITNLFFPKGETFGGKLTDRRSFIMLKLIDAQIYQPLDSRLEALNIGLIVKFPCFQNRNISLTIISLLFHGLKKALFFYLCDRLYILIKVFACFTIDFQFFNISV